MPDWECADFTREHAMYTESTSRRKAWVVSIVATFALASLSAQAAKPVVLDACAAVGDFPAFVYIAASANKSRSLYLSDTSGKCIRAIATVDTAVPPVLSYPILETLDTGRVVWQENQTIYAIDFTIAPPNNPRQLLCRSA
jgi:hypothetical protein